MEWDMYPEITVIENKASFIYIAQGAQSTCKQLINPLLIYQVLHSLNLTTPFWVGGRHDSRIIIFL